MFVVNEDNSIYLTRGDVVYLCATAEDDGVPFQFQPGDVLRIKVYDKKGCENVVLQKDFPVTEATEKATILLTEEDTKIGGVINKPKDYWYEVELNPDSCPITIIGYNEDGPALFRLFPEGADIEKDEPQITPEDIPIVDEELDLLSDRPVQNRAITKMYIRLLADIEELKQNGVSDERIAEAVAEYLEENPLEIPNKVSAFENDAGYLTEHQDLSEYAKTKDLAQVQDDLEEQKAKLDVITVTEDGFTDISGLRRLKSWGVVENGNTVTLNYTLEGDESHTDVMTFDENGYPISIVADGFEALGSWTVTEEAAGDD